MDDKMTKEASFEVPGSASHQTHRYCQMSLLGIQDVCPLKIPAGELINRLREPRAGEW